MAFTVIETYRSREVTFAFDKQSAIIVMCGFGSTDDVEVRTAFGLETPLVFLNLLFQDLNIVPVGGGFWTATANYSSQVTIANPGQGGASPPTSPPPPAPADTEPVGAGFSFDISVDTETIYQAKALVNSTKRGGGTPTDTKGAIGATIDGEVKGCEKIRAKLEWSETRTLDFITTNGIRTLARIVGTVNDEVFYGFAPGEVLMIGASGQGKDLEKVEVTYKFAVERNRLSIPICDGLVVPSKDGWHFLDVMYKNVADANVPTMQPFQATVWQIYDESDFEDIGIGT